MSNNLLALAARAKSKAQAAARPVGKVLFALDASASRENTWNMSKKLTKPVFEKIASIGDLSVSLGFFNGGDANNGYEDQCQFADYTSDPNALIALMDSVACQMCSTQIRKVLDHAALEALNPARPSVMIYVGDCNEENNETLFTKAKALAAVKLPVFMFLEKTQYTGSKDRKDFQTIAELSGGAFAEFDEGAANKMADFIASAVTFAVGGIKALTKAANAGDESARLLLTQVKKD